MHTHKPLITTIIPTYSRAERLKQAIESVLNQTFENFILIVSDNASTDHTQEVVLHYQKQDSRVHYIKREKNIGLEGNFTEALRLVQTPYFSFLGDDDTLLPQFYEITLEGFARQPTCGFSICRTKCLGKEHHFLLSTPAPGYYPLEKTIPSLLSGGVPAFFSILFRREILQKVRGIQPAVGSLIDIDFVYRSALYFPFIISDRVGQNTLLWEGSASSTIADLVKIKEFKLLEQSLKEEMSLAKRSNISFTPLFYRWYTKKFASHLYNKHFIEAKTCLDFLYTNLTVFKKYTYSLCYYGYKFLPFFRPLIKLFMRKGLLSKS